MAIFNADISSEMLLKLFLRELLTDPAITPVVALHLVKVDPESRWRITGQLAQISDVKGSFWTDLVKKITEGGVQK